MPLRGCHYHVAWQDGCLECRRSQAFADWLGSYQWQVFGTITIARYRVDADGVPVFPDMMPNESFARRFRTVCSIVQRDLGRPLVAVIGVESHVSGYPHGHFLLGFSGGVQPGDFRGFVRIAWQKMGFCRLEFPRDRVASARYAAKYLLKDGGMLEFYPDPIAVGRSYFVRVLADQQSAFETEG